MNRAELVAEVARRTGLSRRQAASVVTATLETVADKVASGERVSVTGFGTFERRDRPARTVRNPKTGATVAQPKSRIAVFRPGTGLKTYVAMSRSEQAAYRRSRR